MFDREAIGAGQKTIEDEIDFEFKFKEGFNKSKVKYIYPDCWGCTKPRLTDEGITGKVVVKNAGPYNQNINPINKYIYVIPNDGIDEFMANDDGIRVANPNKNIVRLTINAIVKT